MIGAFQRDAKLLHLYRASVSFVTGYCSPAFVRPYVQPLEIHGRSDKNNTHCELYGGLIMLTSRTTAPPPPPISERLRWNIASSGNCLPLACALLFRRLSLGSGASTSRRPVCRTDLYRAANGRENATLQPLDAPRYFPPSFRHGRKAENAPPRYVQHSGRVRLI